MVEVDKKAIAEIAKKHDLALVVLFGSRARGDARKNSDFDVAYSSISPLDLSEESRMAVELHNVFKTIQVDLVNIRNASPLLLKRIVEGGIVLYEAKESLFNNLYLYAMRVHRESTALHRLRREFVFHIADIFKKHVASA